MSKPSQPTLFDHQTDWFQSKSSPSSSLFFLSFSLTPPPPKHTQVHRFCRYLVYNCLTYIVCPANMGRYPQWWTD